MRMHVGGDGSGHDATSVRVFISVSLLVPPLNTL